MYTHTPIQLLDFWHAIASWLVVLTCFNHLEKYEFVNGKDDIPYMKWKKTSLKPPASYGTTGHTGEHWSFEPTGRPGGNRLKQWTLHCMSTWFLRVSAVNQTTGLAPTWKLRYDIWWYRMRYDEMYKIWFYDSWWYFHDIYPLVI